VVDAIGQFMRYRVRGDREGRRWHALADAIGQNVRNNPERPDEGSTWQDLADQIGQAGAAAGRRLSWRGGAGRGGRA